jgi:hypothetical protein
MKKMVWICLLFTGVALLFAANHQLAQPMESAPIGTVGDVTANKDGNLPNGIIACDTCTVCPATYQGHPLAGCLGIAANTHCYYTGSSATYVVYNQSCS